MKRITVIAGDTIRVTARDVTHATTGSVTTGLTGSVVLYDAANTVVGTFPITLNSGDDWYVDIAAPATVGLYRIEMVLTVGSAQRTLEAELRVV